MATIFRIEDGSTNMILVWQLFSNNQKRVKMFLE
jgi:hypothetical protein